MICFMVRTYIIKADVKMFSNVCKNVSLDSKTAHCS